MRAVVLVVAAMLATGAAAQEMEEVPTPPPTTPPPTTPPQEPCCVVTEPVAPRPPGSLLLDVSAGPTYRRAFKEDFAAAAVELEIGGQTPTWGVVGRLRGDFGGTRVGLPYQFVTVGPAFMFRVSPRMRVGFGLTFGTLSYQRVSAARLTDPTVWALTVGADVDATVDLVRTQRGGAVFLAARAGYDFIDNTGDDVLSTGSSVAITTAVGYRY
jgi:hypothetical protein